MKPEDKLNERVRDRFQHVVKLFGRNAAVCYAQRVVGRPETGGLTLLDTELMSATSPDNFLNYYRNICVAHVRASAGTPQQKEAMLKQLG